MPYQKLHPSCSENNCHSYSAYIRVKKKWKKAGEYNSMCRTFTPDDDVKTYSEIKEEERVRRFKEELKVNPHLRRLVGIKDVDISNGNSRRE